jgi:hypothetical protein
MEPVNTIYIGCDPGLSGGIAAIDSKSRVIGLWDMPTRKMGKKNAVDPFGVAAIMRQLRVDAKEKNWNIAPVVIELVGSMPGQGSVSGFTFGAGWGLLQGAVAGSRLRYELVRPQSWKRLILKGYIPEVKKRVKGGAKKTTAQKAEEKKAGKKATIRFCKDKWPRANLIPPRCRTPSDGRADSLCLALYGLKAK